MEDLTKVWIMMMFFAFGIGVILGNFGSNNPCNMHTDAEMLLCGCEDFEIEQPEPYDVDVEMNLRY